MAEVDCNAISRSCTKCGVTKELNEFALASRGKYGRQAQCRACVALYAKERSADFNRRTMARYHRINGERVAERKRQKEEYRLARQESKHKICCKCRNVFDKENFGPSKSTVDGLRANCKECHRKSNAESRARNIEKSRAASLNWQKNNPNKATEKKKRWQESNPERPNFLAKRWRENNRDRCKENHARRMKENPQLRIHKAMSEGIRRGIKTGKQGKRTFDILPYSLKELCAHIERQFLRGMDWANYGSWHIDHIRPLSSFGFNEITQEDFLDAWSLSNLRRLWAAENLSKSAKRLY